MRKPKRTANQLRALFKERWGFSLSLERGTIIGYDASRMAFEFTMIDKATVVSVACQISSAAMDQLAGTKGTMPDEREAQFHALRDAIERIASDLFEEGISSPDGAIRIFYHHVR
jgi:hypothetical protein